MAAEFVHRFLPATSNEQRTLLMLHGTGGNEDDLIPLAQALLPGAAILSPRGRIEEAGMPRFFRRFAEGVFDVDNIGQEAGALAEFVRTAAVTYGFDPALVTAIGFSNGANMAHSTLTLHPEAIANVVAIRGMQTLPDVTPGDLTGKRVLLTNGKMDPIVPVPTAESLATQLRDAGAQVDLKWLDTGHNLTREDVDLIRDFLAA